MTVDRTSLQWNDLVLSVFNQSDAAQSLSKEDYEAVRSLLEDSSIDAKKKASVVCQAAEMASETEALEPILEDLLYTTNGWQEGYILRNLSRLVMGLALLGQRVRIITTNYDDYIERAVLNEIAEWRKGVEEEPELPVPGFVVSDVNGDEISHPVHSARGAADVGLIYIHGRKSVGQPADGRLVFSEDSYSKNRHTEVDFLIRQFHEDAALLVIGASFNDEPLVEALIRTKSSQTDRFALLVPWGRTLEEREARSLVDRLRGDHLGVQILSPASFSQVAQFIEELRILLFLDSLDAQELYFDQFSYGKRLRRWWEAWTESRWHLKHTKHFEILRDTVQEVHSYFRKNGIVRSSTVNEPEVLKLEAWVRVDPSVSGDRRHLTHWANSIGPLRTHEAFRRERIEPSSSIASVVAFQNGRPTLLGLSDLGYEAHASRWKSFLAVPIFIEDVLPLLLSTEEDITHSLEVAGSVPVAVMCLASTLPLEVDSEGGDVASFKDQTMDSSLYHELLAHLIGSGRAIAGLRTHSA